MGVVGQPHHHHHHPPEPYGRRLHPKLQQVDCEVNDIPSLLEYLKDNNNGIEADEDLDIQNLSTWFSNRRHDDEDNKHRIAFWTPKPSALEDEEGGGEEDDGYDILTYGELQEEILKCPAFGGSTTTTTTTAAAAARGPTTATRVAIVLPAEEMAATATTVLATMAQPNNAVTAVPLGPKITWDAILQLGCQVLVMSTTTLLEEESSSQTKGNAAAVWFESQQGKEGEEDKKIVLRHRLSHKVGDEEENLTTVAIQEYASTYLKEIRLVQPGICGRLEWSVYQQQERNEEEDDHHQLCWVKVDTTTAAAAAGSGAASQPALPLAATDNSTSAPLDNNASPTATTPVLLLRTSGTTAQPKIVPITKQHLWYAAKSISVTLQLTPNDCCVNAMPLFHIGGIACNLLGVLVSGGSVILQGPFHNPSAFLGHITAGSKHQQQQQPQMTMRIPTATWYYASPSMHKALALVAQGQPPSSLQNQLRFCRSASAHMPHELAMQISKLFDCGVIPTYGMSEAMPICSSIPLRYSGAESNNVVDTVGYPTGTHVKIVDPETFQVLPHGEEQIGEICVKGTGVITHYENLDTGFTPDGWLMTGDLGILDKDGRLFIKGRSKELIKRGGEQIWPNHVDSIIQSVEGVATAVTFGVPNPLFGEEVATAVVPVQSGEGVTMDQEESLRQRILIKCKQQLEPNSIPQQIIVLKSTNQLLRGSTGKYLRSKMAAHLQLQAVDTGALRMLEMVSTVALPPSQQHQPDNSKDLALQTTMHTKSSTAETEDEDCTCSENLLQQQRVIPHDSLNGLRFLVACLVVHTHVGLYPNLPWIKLQSNNGTNIMVFFGLGAFQTTCSVARPVKSQWATWVGTKIGTLHALFVISQFIALPSQLLWSCYDENGDFANCNATDYVSIFIKWLLGTTTGMMHGLDVNYFAWFQSTFYIFLIFFPWLDDFLRRQSSPTVAAIMSVCLIIAMTIYLLASVILPTEFFNETFWMAQFSFVTWSWYLIACMCATYFFKSVVTRHWRHMNDPQQEMEEGCPTTTERTYKNSVDKLEEGESCKVDGPASINPDSIDVESIKERTKFWGYVCDGCTLVLLALVFALATYNDSLCIKPETFEAMRGLEELESANECHVPQAGFDGTFRAEAVTYEEFMEYIHPDLDYYGRFFQVLSLAPGYWKMASPLFILWIYAMAFGNGITSRIFGHRIMTSLAPLGYPIYLLQYSVSRYYWLATRGSESQFWWIEAGVFPFPVAWYEYFVILGLTIALGLAINRWLVPILMPRTISWGVSVCTWISEKYFFLVSRLRGGNKEGSVTDNLSVDTPPEAAAAAAASKSTFDQIKSMVAGLTGVHVTRSVELRTLGLDSLGTTALLGMLRASVPAAKKLTLRQLQSCETVGDLANVLDGRDDTTTSPGSSHYY